MGNGGFKVVTTFLGLEVAFVSKGTAECQN